MAFQNFRPCGASANHNLFYCHTPASQSAWSPISIVTESKYAKHNGFPMYTGFPLIPIVRQPWQRRNAHNSTIPHGHGQCVTVSIIGFAKSCLFQRIQDACGTEIVKSSALPVDTGKWEESGKFKSFRQYWSPICIINGNNFAKFNGQTPYANVTMRFCRFPMSSR